MEGSLPEPVSVDGPWRPESFVPGTRVKVSGTNMTFVVKKVNDISVSLLDDTVTANWQAQLKHIDHCHTCGTYGYESEFYKPNYCVRECYLSSLSHLSQEHPNAPIHFFKRPALPSDPNPFRVGQLMEAIDPENQSLFCVVSVTSVRGARIELHFEGYSQEFDFWVNSSSWDIFPPKWCESHGYTLQPPGNHFGKFIWEKYLRDRNQVIPQEDIFEIIKEYEDPDGVDESLIGKKLEAVDIQAKNLVVCVATITNVLGHRFLIHFDSWDNLYDYWADATSPFIFPVGHCERNNVQLIPPNGYKNFSWDKYLEETSSVPVPSNFFTPPGPIGFKKGMRLEAVDMRNPRLIRPAIVAAVDKSWITIHYEGWSDIFDVRISEICNDIHPVGYCEQTGHPLEKIPDKSSKEICPNYCERRGNLKSIKKLTHFSILECPYVVERKKPERVLILFQGSPSNRKTLIVPPHKISMGDVEVEGAPPPKRPRKHMKRPTHKKISNFETQIVKKKQSDEYLFQSILQNITFEDVKSWGTRQVYEFISSLPDCGKIAELLRYQLVDGDALSLLDLPDLQEMSFGQGIKVYYAIETLRQQSLR